MIIYLEALGIKIEGENNKGSLTFKSDGSVVINAPAVEVKATPVKQPQGPFEMQSAVVFTGGGATLSPFEVARTQTGGCVQTQPSTAILMNNAEPELRVGVSELDKVEKAKISPLISTAAKVPLPLETVASPVDLQELVQEKYSGLAESLTMLNEIGQNAATDAVVETDAKCAEEDVDLTIEEIKAIVADPETEHWIRETFQKCLHTELLKHDIPNWVDKLPEFKCCGPVSAHDSDMLSDADYQLYVEAGLLEPRPPKNTTRTQYMMDWSDKNGGYQHDRQEFSRVFDSLLVSDGFITGIKAKVCAPQEDIGPDNDWNAEVELQAKEPVIKTSSLDEQPLNRHIANEDHPIIRGSWRTTGTERTAQQAKRVADSYAAAAILAQNNWR